MGGGWEGDGRGMGGGWEGDGWGRGQHMKSFFQYFFIIFLKLSLSSQML